MAPDDSSGARPAPVVLRIKLRYDDVEAMIARFAPNVGKTGLFLPTRSIQPLGAEIKFELRLSTDQPVLVGLGRVKAVREPDPDDQKATFGMAVELMRVTRESRDLILKMLERRKQLGLPETGLPMPADIDAARRSDLVDTGVKDSASGAIPQLVPATDSSPSRSSSTSFSEPLLTAPRRQSGPIAVAKIAVVEPLAPEPSRKRRVPVAELIASASGPIVASFTTDALDEDVDVSAVLARARTLAMGSSSDLDGELAALLDAAAAPIEIGIEAASAELARQLGGAAVRRDRSGSARWAPPPAVEAKVETPVEVPVPVEAPVEPVEAKAEPEADIVAPEPAAPEPAAPEIESPRDDAAAAAPAVAPVDDDDDGDFVDRQPDQSTPVAMPLPRQLVDDDDDDDAAPPTQDDDDARAHAAPLSTESNPGLIHDGADASQFEDAHEVQPEQIHDEIHRLDEGDFEEVEHTQIGEQPIDPAAFDQHAFATLPAEHVGIAERLDAQLAEAEREDLGFSEPVEPASASVEDDEIEEIEDFEILAEADAEDADLLASAAEQEISGAARPASYGTPAAYDEMPEHGSYRGTHEPYGRESYERQGYEPQGYEPSSYSDAAAVEDHGFELPPARPSFLNRLSLDDDSGYHTPAASNHFDELSPELGEIDPRQLSAGHALRAFEDPDEHSDFNSPGTFTPVPPLDPYADSVGEQSYTFANTLGNDEFDAPHGNYVAPSGGGGRAESDLDPGSMSGSFIPPDAFDQSDVISIRPATVQPKAAPRPGDDDFPDLESALEALDVDLDDLGRPGTGQARRPARGPGGARSVRAGNASEVPTARGRRESNLATSPTVDAGAHDVRQPGAPGRTHKRATTEDGIEIDFDDDD